MKNNKQKSGFAPIAVIITCLAVFSGICCGFLVASHVKPELRENIKENFSFLYKAPGEDDENSDRHDKKGEKVTARLMCAGNNTVYKSIYTEAKKNAEDTEDKYNFLPIYEDIKKIITVADVAMVNETAVLSAENEPSTYPKFRSPAEVADALTDTGFTLINHANRDIWDKGEDEVIETADIWKSKGADVVGVYKKDEEPQAVIRSVNGIKLAFLGFTEKTAYSADTEQYSVISLDEKGSTQADVYNKMKSAIKKAKETADAVIVSMCFEGKGNEPSETQKTVCDYLVSFGADVVIGCGINAIQPMEYIERDDGTKALVAYSLGNFLSAEEKKENMLGGIADITFTRDEDGKTEITEAGVFPVTTYYEKGFTGYRLLPYGALTEETLENHFLNTRSGGFDLNYAVTSYEEIFGEFLEKSVK